MIKIHITYEALQNRKSLQHTQTSSACKLINSTMLVRRTCQGQAAGNCNSLRRRLYLLLLCPGSCPSSVYLLGLTYIRSVVHMTAIQSFTKAVSSTTPNNMCSTFHSFLVGNKKIACAFILLVNHLLNESKSFHYIFQNHRVYWFLLVYNLNFC